MSGDDEREDKLSLEDTRECPLIKVLSYEFLCRDLGDDDGGVLLDLRPMSAPIKPMLEADEVRYDSESTSVFGFGRVKVLTPSVLSSTESFSFFGFCGNGGGGEEAPEETESLGGSCGFSTIFEEFGAAERK